MNSKTYSEKIHIGEKIAIMLGGMGGVPLFAIISSFLFVIAHHDGHFLTYFVMGCIFEFIYYKAHDIRASMIAHAGLNLITLLLWGIH